MIPSALTGEDLHVIEIIAEVAPDMSAYRATIGWASGETDIR
jgi:hypothetical protein